MKLKIIHYIKEIVLFLIIITISSNIISLYKSDNLTSKPLDITSFKLIDGTDFHIDNSKPILIHFWATWCPTCKLEASNIDTISKNFQVITIAVQSDKNQDIQKFLKQNSLNFMVVNDRDSSFAHNFNISAYPTTFIYNKKRELVFSDVGYTSTLGLWLRMWWATL